MGKPGFGNTRSSDFGRRRTRGTETSKYPEEKKSKEIPSVAASERGRAQTQRSFEISISNLRFEISRERWGL